MVRPTKFELIVNLRAAKAIGLKISEAFLLWADEVIDWVLMSANDPKRSFGNVAIA